jgi:hypothetical protein
LGKQVFLLLLEKKIRQVDVGDKMQSVIQLM